MTMTRDEANESLMDIFKLAWCSECVIPDAHQYHNCNKYCGAFRQFKEAIAVLEKNDDSKRFSDSAEPSIVRCMECKSYIVMGDTTKYGWCKEHETAIDEWDFCSYGERREP